MTAAASAAIAPGAATPAGEPGAAWRQAAGTSLGSSVLAIIAIVAALYLARGFFVPLLIGMLASYALHPLVDWLERGRVPRTVGAALVLATVVGSFWWIGASMSADAEALIEKLPEAARKLRQDLSAARSGAPTALQNMQEAASQLQGAAADAGARPDNRTATIARPTAPTALAAQVAEPTWLRDYTLTQSALLASVAAQTPIVLMLTYFLLASGPHFRGKLLQLVGPSLTAKQDAVRILEEIDVQVQRYLLTVLASNALL